MSLSPTRHAPFGGFECPAGDIGGNGTAPTPLPGMAKATRDLNEGPIWRALAVVSAPMTIGILAVLSVGLVDAYFLGRLGESELAAVGFVYPVTTAITSLSIGLSAGANAALSQAIGRRDDESAVNRTGLQAIGLGTLLAVLTALAFWMLDGPIFRLLGAEGDALRAVLEYTPVWAISFPFLVAMMVGNAVFRAHGKSGLAASTMVLAAVVNVALDPVLIFGWGPIPALGMEGAAWATVAGRVASLIAVAVLLFRQELLSLCAEPMRDLRRSLVEVGAVGAPAALSNAINPAGMALVTAAVATLGETAVAGFGAATRIQAIAIVPLLALSSGIGPVVGQAWGAGMRERAQGAVGLTFALCAGYGIAVGAVLFFFAEPLAGFVATEGAATERAAQYLRVVGWSLAGYGILVTGNAAMNARSKAVWSMALGLARVFAVYLPLAWAGVSLFGYAGVLGAAVAANLAAIAGVLYATGRTGLLTFGGGPGAATATPRAEPAE